MFACCDTEGIDLTVTNGIQNDQGSAYFRVNEPYLRTHPAADKTIEFFLVSCIPDVLNMPSATLLRNLCSILVSRILQYLASRAVTYKPIRVGVVAETWRAREAQC